MIWSPCQAMFRLRSSSITTSRGWPRRGEAVLEILCCAVPWPTMTRRHVWFLQIGCWTTAQMPRLSAMMAGRWRDDGA